MSSQLAKSLIIEGNIGAGKSTFLKIVQRFLDSDIVFEPHTKWQDIGGENLLNKFYKDTKRWAYTFQTYAFITRVLEQEKNARETKKEFQVLERSVYSDRYCFAKNCFEMGTMTQMEWSLYKDWFSWLVEQYTAKPTGFIYLKTDPDICYNRLIKRNRSEEAGVPLEYLTLLDKKHNDWLIKKEGISAFISDVPVLVLDCNKDFEFDVNEQIKHMNAIADFFGVKIKEKQIEAELRASI
jgi:deoxyadenosine/deoxycytidine kinase